MVRGARRFTSSCKRKEERTDGERTDWKVKGFKSLVTQQASGASAGTRANGLS